MGESLVLFSFGNRHLVIICLPTKLLSPGDNEETFWSVKLSPAHLSATHGKGFILSFFIAERQAGRLGERRSKTKKGEGAIFFVMVKAYANHKVLI